MFYILRHGQTDQNLKRMLQGRRDVPLNDTGRAQARAAGEYFRAQGIAFDRVYSSPLCRARETAELAAGPDAVITLDEHLLEMDYGPYEGLLMGDLPPEVQYFFDDFVNHPAPPGMEPLAHVVARLGEFLEGLPRSGTGNTLLATHAIAMKGALDYLTPADRDEFWRHPLPNCALYCFDVREDGSFTLPQEIKYAKGSF